MAEYPAEIEADLDTPYSVSEETGYFPRLAERLGVSCDQVRRLHSDLRGDRSAEKLGIAWWAPGPGTRRRILIADYLIEAIASIELNFTEAQLHLLSYEDNTRRVSRFVADFVGHGGVRARTRPRDDLPFVLAELHTAGVGRAVGSALDCRAAGVIGVVAVPIDLRRASLRDLTRLKTTRPKVWANLNDDQKDVLSEVLKAEDAAGPAGWCDWILELRNMMVHRARRISKSLLRQTAMLFDARGSPRPQVEAVAVLPKEPLLSEIEILASGDIMSVLSESASVTLHGVVGSARQFANDTANLLSAFWAARKRNPAALPQPASQWPKQLAPQNAFAGYRPGEVIMDAARGINTHPDFLTRLQVASLDGDRKAAWAAFD